ncbi:AAA family ATPase [Psychrobacter sp. 4Bb]|uniref:AAA family ATPase n=1 Tax=Psychrobacter sp. 4Bb TaxID=888436 RepID=UPI000C79CA13|nr:AAA family ATPase [Psychrobacter sp. 4Bb]PKH80985.1 ABC transporter ATP-binding protein [Psychrobacter sp. 4Bb]
MSDDNALTKVFNVSYSKFLKYKELALYCGVESPLFEQTEQYFGKLNSLTAEIFSLKINYRNQVVDDCIGVIDAFKSELGIDVKNIEAEQKPFIKDYYFDVLNKLNNALKIASFNLELFSKFNFFHNNIVAIGANGSGKSTLSAKLKEYLPKSAMTISAQKLLIIPVFKNVTNPIDTTKDLQELQSHEKSTRFKSVSDSNYSPETDVIKNEFKVLLNNLLSENNTLNNEYVQSVRNGENCSVPESKLIKAIEIWNSLIDHRVLECSDGININLKTKGSEDSYPAYQMSDGEKVVLYYIAHVLQAPQDGFIIVDEPEMYLHKTLLSKLWDILESEREDCIFVYLTHDLEFATSRNTAKKVWIKSFNHPNKWEIENIPSNELPEALLLKLLGSRKRILFCESESGKIDEKIYNLLLPKFTITPVKTCFDVINYTKAFNELPNKTAEAFGLIDSDHHDSDRLSSLQAQNVFSLNVSEVENLLFDEGFLRNFSRRMMCDDDVVSTIKSEVIEKLSNTKELQVANYISAKINYYFKSSHVSKGNTREDVKTHYSRFTDNISIDEWHDARETELQNIIDSKDYDKALCVINDKGLKTIANRNFNIGNFQEKALNYLQFNHDSHQHLLKHLPSELTAG